MTPYLRFRVGQTWYGLAIQAIVEALNLVAITPLPQVSPLILGVIPFRRHSLQVFDLCAILEGQPIHLSLDTPILVLKTTQDAPTRAYVVDELDQVVELDEDGFASVEESLLVRRVARYADETLLIVDEQQLAHLSGAAQALPDSP